jgi:hypothetical protein
MATTNANLRALTEQADKYDRIGMGTLSATWRDMAAGAAREIPPAQRDDHTRTLAERTAHEEERG